MKMEIHGSQQVFRSKLRVAKSKVDENIPRNIY